MLPKKYSELLAILKEKIRYSRSIAILLVNSQMLAVYWEIGNTLDDLINAGGYGAKTIDRVAADLKAEFPEMKGLRRRSLHYMREFARAYPEFSKVQQPAAQLPSVKDKKRGKKPTAKVQQVAALLENKSQQAVALIPWAHHQVILDKIKTLNERLFYIQRTVEQGWSRNVLALQIESRLYERQGKSITDFKNTLPKINSDLAQETFKNPYLLDFLDIGEEIRERDLENALIQPYL